MAGLAERVSKGEIQRALYRAIIKGFAYQCSDTAPYGQAT